MRFLNRILTILLATIITLPVFTSVRTSADTATKTQPIPDETLSNSQKTYTFSVEGTVDLSSISYSGKGTIQDKKFDGNTLTVTIAGEATTLPSEPVTGFKGKAGQKFLANPGNRIWRYADGVRWQINSYNKNTMSQTSKDVNGYDVNDDGIAEQPAANGSMPVTTYIDVTDELAKESGVIWVGDNTGTQYTSSDIDFSHWIVKDVETDSTVTKYPSNPFTIKSDGSGGYNIMVDHLIHHNNVRDITSEAPPSIGTGGNVKGNNYAAPFTYLLAAKSKPTTAYRYGGTLSYTILDPAYVSADATANPSSKQYDGNDTTVIVTVTGTLHNFTDTAKIDHWTLYARKSQDSVPQSQTIYHQNLTQSADFSFVIKASTVTSDDFTQVFKTTARVYFKDGTYLDASADCETNIYKQAPPTTQGPPVAIIDTEPTAVKGQAHNVSGARSYDPDGTIVKYEWNIIGPATYSGTLSGAEGGDLTFTQQYTYTIQLKVTDDSGLTDTDSKTIEIGNEPPVADFDPYPNPTAEGYPVQIMDNSYDPDGYIAVEEWSGENSEGLSRHGGLSYIQYDKPGTYPLTLKVWDNDSAEASITKNIIVMSKKPEAVITVRGTQKQNRKVILDSGASRTPPVYPIDFSKDEWIVTPLTASVTSSDIKWGTKNGSQQEMLFKKPGDYLVKLRVHNSVEASDWTEKTITIAPDLPPVADFNLAATSTYRNPDDGNQATIIAVDRSYSPDGDTIQHRSWYLIYDSNNNGDFSGEQRQLVSDGNEPVLKVKVKDVGHYQVELEVTEGFGQPTIPEFINPSDYLKAGTWY